MCKKVANIYKGLARTAKTTWGLSPEIVRAMCACVPTASKLSRRYLSTGNSKDPRIFCELPHLAHIPELEFESIENLDPTTKERLVSVGTPTEAASKSQDLQPSGPCAETATFWKPSQGAGRCAYFGTETTDNERVDELAKNAALKKKTAADYDRFRYEEENQSHESGGMKAEIAERSTGGITKCFFPQ
ncbi:hypothetical protein EVAR_33614_1 [Eumeta japonica]|uniref:Uncharacterized protein n=1 Tax=Eumeta variegata TaxID=151549 RepID=A0A4C1WCN4_EUMVA|nr:hypothetical protein EVAR_33614_1 [Eumeta japonica]